MDEEIERCCDTETLALGEKGKQDGSKHYQLSVREDYLETRS